MKIYGIIGKPLGQTFSKKYYNERFSNEGITDSVFENFELSSINDLPQMLASNPTLEGFNITIPYKQQIMSYLDQIAPQAKEVGAVNCVRVTRHDGKPYLVGHNTDVVGFGDALASMIGERKPAALVLGTGGASKAVCYVLKKMGIEFKLVSRRDGLTYSDLTPEIIESHKLIINTTPLGTFPNTTEAADIPYSAIGADHYLFDLVYNPPLTTFLERGLERGATVKNGYSMLIGQAEVGFKLMRDL